MVEIKKIPCRNVFVRISAEIQHTRGGIPLQIEPWCSGILCQLVDLLEWPEAPVTAIDWTLCIICQITSSQQLITSTPAADAGCLPLTNNLTAFAELGALLN